MSFNKNAFIVITRTKFPKNLYATAKSMADLSYPIFMKQKGLISLAMHESLDQTETSAYFQWESEADHLACMQSSDWGDFNEKWQVFSAQPGVSFDLQVYRITHS